MKFFHRTRQKLLSKNLPDRKAGKFSKYLLYALGEIFLVVIGILIALQINNWNEARKNANTEKEYYNGFLEDVLLDEIIVQEQIKITEQRLLSANQLLSELQMDEPKMLRIGQTLVGAVSQSNFELKPTQTTYEDVKSSGNVHLIKDLELKRLLDDYYANTSGMMNYINRNAEKLGNRLFASDEMLGIGMYHIPKIQGGFDESMVNLNELEKLTELSPLNKSWLLNSGVVYVALNNRNLEHFKTIQKSISEIKAVLETKVIKLKSD